MTYDFNRIIDRKGKFGNYKWDNCPFPTDSDEPIPMWIADMDIPAADFIIEAMQARLDHPIFGYFAPDERYYDAIINWQRRRNGWNGLIREHIQYQNGVLGAIDTAITTFTDKGDYILVQSPGYHQFKNAIDRLEREICVSSLTYKDGRYELDYEHIEQKIKENHIKLVIFCSPHNPTGRVWQRDELEAFVDICHRHGVTIISDEIHSDLILSGKHIPLQTLSDKAKEITISLYAPTKTFNLAGLVTAYSITLNNELAKKYNEASTASHYNWYNTFSIEATTAAYEKGDRWVDELCEHLKGNMEYVRQSFLEAGLPIDARIMESTFLQWLDFRETGLSHEEIVERCQRKTGVLMHSGSIFIKNGEGFMRMNVGCPRIYVEEAAKRLCEEFA